MKTPGFSQTEKLWRGLLVLAVITSVALPRLLHLDRFSTVDEPTWLLRSANFYYALGQRDWDNTGQAYHPAVTTMWGGVVGLWRNFPEYRGLGQGYFDSEQAFNQFLRDAGQDPLDFLKSSRQVIVLANLFLLLVIFGLLLKILGWQAATVMLFVLGLEPPFLGHSRLLTHEGLMSPLLIISSLAFYQFLSPSGTQNKRVTNWLFLLVSAISGALAALTKSSAIIILGFIGLLTVLYPLFRPSRNRRTSSGGAQLRWAGKILAAWMVAFLLTYLALFPQTWVNPGQVLMDTYGNAFSYAFFGRNLAIAQHLEQTQTNLDILEGLKTNLLSLLWQSSLTMWGGALIMSADLVAHWRKILSNRTRRLTMLLFVFGGLFFLMMSIAGGRRARHYIMFTQVCLSMVAGLGFATLIKYLREKKAVLRNRILLWVGILILVSTHLAASLSQRPYYYTYINPVMQVVAGTPSTYHVGIGEGLELAGAYLGEMPDADQKTAFSWYGVGCFSYFFPGKTELLPPWAQWSDGSIARLEKSDYLVIYYQHQQARNEPASLLQALENAQPIHTIFLNGFEYIRIYAVETLPPATFIPDEG